MISYHSFYLVNQLEGNINVITEHKDQILKIKLNDICSKMSRPKNIMQN